jgi:hypothetical protein
MSKVMAWLSLAGLCGGFVLMPFRMGQAEPEKSAAQEEKAAARRTGTVSGRITAVDPAAGTVTVQRRKGETATFTVTPETVILIGDEPGALANLAPQTTAEIAYRAVDGKRVARWIWDALTVRIRNAESVGVPAVITALQPDQGSLTVRTDFGKVRELKLVAGGKNASRIMKQGQPADLSAFQVNEPVRVSIRRTTGGTLYLKGLAEEMTFVAFLQDRRMEGQFRSLDPLARRIVVAPSGGEPVTVGFSRRTQFFRGGQALQEPSFQAGQELIVLYRGTQKGLIQARAVFDRESWKAYAQAALTAEKEKKLKKGQN